MSHTGTTSQNGSSQTAWRTIVPETVSQRIQVHGLDCELVHTMNGLEVARARIEDTDNLDTFVLPQYEIDSLKTAFAGITIMDSPLWPT